MAAEAIRPVAFPGPQPLDIKQRTALMESVEDILYGSVSLRGFLSTWEGHRC